MSAFYSHLTNTELFKSSGNLFTKISIDFNGISNHSIEYLKDFTDKSYKRISLSGLTINEIGPVDPSILHELIFQVNQNKFGQLSDLLLEVGIYKIIKSIFFVIFIF
jgi:hypothetical protein